MNSYHGPNVATIAKQLYRIPIEGVGHLSCSSHMQMYEEGDSIGAYLQYLRDEAPPSEQTPTGQFLYWLNALIHDPEHAHTPDPRVFADAIEALRQRATDYREQLSDEELAYHIKAKDELAHYKMFGQEETAYIKDWLKERIDDAIANNDMDYASSLLAGDKGFREQNRVDVGYLPLIRSDIEATRTEREVLARTWQTIADNAYSMFRASGLEASHESNQKLAKASHYTQELLGTKLADLVSSTYQEDYFYIMDVKPDATIRDLLPAYIKNGLKEFEVLEPLADGVAIPTKEAIDRIQLYISTHAKRMREELAKPEKKSTMVVNATHGALETNQYMARCIKGIAEALGHDMPSGMKMDGYHKIQATLDKAQLLMNLPLSSLLPSNSLDKIIPLYALPKQATVKDLLAHYAHPDHQQKCGPEGAYFQTLIDFAEGTHLTPPSRSEMKQMLAGIARYAREDRETLQEQLQNIKDLNEHPRSSGEQESNLHNAQDTADIMRGMGQLYETLAIRLDEINRGITPGEKVKVNQTFQLKAPPRHIIRNQ